MEYSKISNPTLNDALTALKKLILYSCHIEVFKDISDFDELQMETRKLYLSKCSTQEAMIVNLYQNYVLLKKLNKLLDNYTFNVVCLKWEKFQDDLVSINNSEIYFKINELYDKMYSISPNEKDVSFIIDSIDEVLVLIKKLEKKLKRKC